MTKEFFVKTLSDMNDVAVAKKDISYMLLITPKFKFLDVKNYLALGLSLDDWCRANKCQVEKLVLPYEWLDSYDKLSHVGTVPHSEFYSSLKGKNITTEEYETSSINFINEDVLQRWIGSENITWLTSSLPLKLWKILKSNIIQTK